MKAWSYLKGKKTYVLVAASIGTVLLKSLSDAVRDVPVDWVLVIQEIVGFAAVATLRHGMTDKKQGEKK